MKTISLITRRSDTTRAAFRDYYESQHCALAMRYFPYQLYTRNHLNGSSEPGFDCISEFRMTDEFRASAGNVMASESRARLLADELEFMQPAQIRVAAVEEVVFLADTAAASSSSQQRYALLFCDPQPNQDYLRRMQARLRLLVEGIDGLVHASVDVIKPQSESRFPFDAILWLTFADQPAADASLVQLGPQDGLIHTLSVATFATPLSELQARFEHYLP